MAGFNPTPKQKQVITDQGKDILVSASAGSGKTAVLVRRVIQLLKTHPDLNIDQFLLVTFTKEAAKNMRDRIRSSLLAENNATLRKQLSRLPLANISTIHAFCEQVIKQYYYVIGLDPKYRLLTDDTEENLLRDQVWNDLQEEYLAKNGEFKRLKEAFQDPKSNVGEGLADVVIRLDEIANAQAHPNDWLKQLMVAYQVRPGALMESPFFQAYVLKAIFQELDQLRHALADLIDTIPNDPGFERALIAVQADSDQVEAIADQLEQGNWDAAVELVQNPKFKTWGTKGLDEADKALADDLKAQRDALKDQFKASLPKYLLASEAVMEKRIQIAATYLEQLVAVTQEFRQRYQGVKQAQHLLDFNDLEHYTYQILTTDSTEGRQAQGQLRHHYREIMVDEYQDTNGIQDELVKQLHDPKFNHLFMVGDVKQSIYRFRQADPTLFLDRYREYSGPATDNEAIVLAENFRSMESVTSFVNLVFTQLMDENLGEMAYDDDAQLKYAAKRYEAADEPRPATEMLLYNATEKDEVPDPAVEHYVERQVNDADAGEVWLIGMRIRQMLDRQELIYDQKTDQMRPIQPQDIAILARTKTLNNQIVEQFARLEIPVVVHDVKNYFKAIEVQTVLALLKIIDNPAQDIPLVTVLRSPMYGFTERELAFIRIHHRHDDFYAALIKVKGMLVETEQKTKLQAEWKAWEMEAPTEVGPKPTDFTTFAGKVITFLKQLGHFQQVAEQQALADLIWQIYQTTDYLDYVAAMPGGSQRQANLHAFYQRANEYEQGNFRGLYQFINFIERLQRRNDDLAQAPVEVVGDAVNVMTIHGSKGLQFPVVFLVNSSHQFNHQNQSAPIIVNPHDEMIGLRFGEPYQGDPVIRYRFDLPQREVVLQSLTKQERAEEMRLLYVALTRAEQRLIITAGIKQDPEKLITNWKAAANDPKLVLGTNVRLKAHSMLDWLGMTLCRTGLLSPAQFNSDEAWPTLPGLKTKAKLQFKIYTANQVEAELNALKAVRSDQALTTKKTSLSREERNFINQTMTMVYPYETATRTTAYQSVSAVKEVFANQDPDEAKMGHVTFNQQVAKEEGRYLRGEFGQPDFISAGPTTPSPTLVGTATHLVFQQLDLTKGEVTKGMVTTLIKHLVTSGLIESAQIAENVNVDGIVNFYQTELGQQILANPTAVEREKPFSMLLNGHNLFTNLHPEDGELLIHGIIDGYLTTPDGIIIFDYKTDELKSKGIQGIKDRYQGQVHLYADALHQMTGRPILKQYLYLVRIGELVEV